MENPVRKQLNDFIGRRKITHPQFIQQKSMDRYFSSVGVDGQREIVHGLLRFSDLKKISDDSRKKIVQLYDNLYLLKEPLKKRRTFYLNPKSDSSQKTAIIKLLDQNNRLMGEIIEHLKENDDETVQAIINWTISTVNLFGDVYLKNRCEIEGLKKIRQQAVHLVEQISDIMSAFAEELEAGKSSGGTGMFASKAKKEAQQLLEEKIAHTRKVIANLGKTEKLVDAMREPIFLAQRVSQALQKAADSITPEWQTFFVSRIMDEKGLPEVSCTASHGLKAAQEQNYENSFSTKIREVRENLEAFKQLLPLNREILLSCGVDNENIFPRIIQASRSLYALLSNLFLELQFAYRNGLNRKMQILHDRKTYEMERIRSDKALKTDFARALEEIYPTDFNDRKAALIETIHRGITRDQHSLLRSETNFWSEMKNKLFAQSSESRQSLFIRKRRMVNEILPDEQHYIEYSDKLRKTIDISDKEKAGFDPFVQQDFHELLKYLVSLYREAAEHVKEDTVLGEAEDGQTAPA